MTDLDTLKAKVQEASWAVADNFDYYQGRATGRAALDASASAIRALTIAECRDAVANEHVDHCATRNGYAHCSCGIWDALDALDARSGRAPDHA